MDIKSLVKKGREELFKSPQVQKLVQDPRVMNAAMQAWQLRQKAQDELEVRVEKAAKALGLVTKNEVRELKRSIKELEAKLKRSESSTASKSS